MTIYAAAGDLDSAVMTAGTLETWTSATYHDSAYTNYAVAFHPARTGYIDLAATASEFWFHMHWLFDSWLSGTADAVTFSLGSSLEYKIEVVGGSPTSTLNLRKTTNGSTWTTIVSWIMTSSGNPVVDLDVHLKPHATLGAADVYINGTLVASVSGVNTMAQTSTINRLSFTSVNSGSYLMLSELAVADVPTIGWRVLSLLPNASGQYSEFTGAYTGIDEMIADDADFIISNTTSQRHLVNLQDPNTSTVGSREIKALVVNSRGAISIDSAPTDMQHGLRSNSSDYYTANLGHVADAAVRVKTTIYELNPSTSAKFTLAEAAAVQVGVKAV